MDSDAVPTILSMLLNFVIFVLVVGGCAAAFWLQFYVRPRARAFRNNLNEVSVWMGLGRLILWSPGQTFVFLKNKQVVSTGDFKGGMKTIFPFKGQEVSQPISTRTELATWEDFQALTREAQQLCIKLGLWWKVTDPARFWFGIQEHVEGKAGGLPVRDGVHGSAVQWLMVLTESAVRNHVSQLNVADVVSAQATQLAQAQPSMLSQSSPSSGGGFDSLIEGVRDTVRERIKNYGIEIERLEVQHVELPDDIQKAINETRIAFLAPIREERQAEARKIALEKLGSYVGRDVVGLDMLLQNFRNSNFGYIPPFIQTIMGAMGEKAGAATKPSTDPEHLLPGGEVKKLKNASDPA
jgi:regulator of protease activity HflC (stomatin/prohibitin superfamily)